MVNHNSFIDFNYNLIQDSGEPSATPAESGELGSYVFDYENDFNAIKEIKKIAGSSKIFIHISRIRFPIK